MNEYIRDRIVLAWCRKIDWYRLLPQSVVRKGKVYDKDAGSTSKHLNLNLTINHLTNNYFYMFYYY